MKNPIFTHVVLPILLVMLSGNAIAQVLLAPAKDAGKWGYINQTGQWVVPPTYNFANDFSEDIANVQINGKWGYIDGAGNKVTDALYDDAYSFHNGLARVKKNSLWGYIRPDGSWLIEPQFDLANDFSEGYALVAKNKKYGYLNAQGEVVLDPMYDDAYDFSDRKALVSIGGQWAYIDGTGKTVKLPNCDFASSFWSEDVALVRCQGKYGYVTSGGDWLLEPQYDQATHFSDGLAAVTDNTKQYGYINHKGQIIIPFAYEAASYFSEGLAAVKYNGLFGYIDKTGTWVVPPRYDSAESFKNGMAKIQIDDKFGYINLKGETVVMPQFTWLFDYSEGFAAVQRSGKVGFIDQKSVYAISPDYENVGSFKRVQPLQMAQKPLITLLDNPKDLVVNTPNYTFKAEIATSVPLLSCYLTVNGKVQKDIIAKGTRPVAIKNNTEIFPVDKIVQLAPGKNVVILEAINANGSVESEPLDIYYKPTSSDSKPTLYVLTIGVAEFESNAYNINYADDDARDLAAIFETQRSLPKEQRIFEDIIIKTITNEQATLKEIKKNIVDIRGQATKDDLVLMFISTHGEIDSKGEFYLRAYDTDPGLEHLTSSALENKWLAEQIKEFDCTVIQMMDACHSARAGSELSMKGSAADTELAVKELKASLQSGRALYFFASSSQQQLSQERHEWKNGAFTEAMIDCFAGKDFTYSNNQRIYADSNQDGFLNTNELENYVNKSVKQLTSGQQSPKFYVENGEPISFFVLPTISKSEHK
jgi:hypothetical protein